MVKVIKSEERHHANFGWLDTHWHFSFGPYYDPSCYVEASDRD